MAVYKCKSCGAALNIIGSESVVTCEYCDVQQSVPKVKDDKIFELYEHARELRFNKDFDRAEQAYEKIIEKDRTQAEAYWGIILSRYGVEYVEDPDTKKNIPTCHRASFESVAADTDYKAAVLYADSLQQEVYKKDAETIDNIRKEILRISEKEKPYDIFICYKQKDGEEFTDDSRYASQIYHHLINEGYKVFFAEVSLIDKAGTKYEPYIFAALNSSKVMLVLGTTPEYVNAVWVKNEWSRFIRLMKKDSSKMLFPCYKGMNPELFPEEFNNLQALNMGDIGFISNLMLNIKKYVKKEEASPVRAAAPSATPSTPVSKTSPLLIRANMFLEDGDFESANDYCEKVLDQEPTNAKAYLYKLMCDLELNKVEDLSKIKGSASIAGREGEAQITAFNGANKLAFIKVLREIAGWGLAEAKEFSERPNPAVSFNLSRAQAKELRELGAEIKFANGKKSGTVTFNTIESNGNYHKFIRFASESEKAEVNKYLAIAKEETIQAAKMSRYTSALSDMRRAMNQNEFLSAAQKFDDLGDFEQSKDMAKECREKAEIARKDAIYNSAKAALSSGDPDRLLNAYDDLEKIIDYKDSKDVRLLIPDLVEKAKADILERTRQKDFDYAVNLANRSKIEDVRRAINIYQNLGDYKNSKAMVTVLSTKLVNLENKKRDDTLREKFKPEYNKKYPDASRRDEYSEKCKNLSSSIATLKSTRSSFTPGCFSWAFLVAGIFALVLGICAIIDDEEDLIGALVIGIIILIATIKSIIGKFSSRSGYSSQIRMKELELKGCQNKLAEIAKMPTFDAFIEEKKRSLSKEEIDKIAGIQSGPSIAVPKAPDPVTTQSIKCKLCGALNTVPADDLNVKCSHCSAYLRR